MAELLRDALPVIAGVVGSDPATGGRDSSNEAPNEDVGLKGFKPVNPVMCDLTEEMGDVDPVANGIVDVVLVDKSDALATPVGWDDSGVENKEPGPVTEVAVFVPSVL
jgi:hypothetical protein